MSGVAGRQVWSIQVFIEANETDAQAAVAAVGRALCPNDDHDGYCPVPWTTLLCRFDDLEDEARHSWEREFDLARRAAESDPK